MKTTLEMPDALLRRAELEAQRQGITLDEWVRNTLVGALARLLHRSTPGHGSSFRSLPPRSQERCTSLPRFSAN